MNPYAAAQFDIEVFQPFEVFGSRLCIDIFSEQFRHVGDHLVAFVGTLDQHLAILLFPSAIDEFLFHAVADLNRVGDDIGFSRFQHFDQFGRTFGNFNIQFQTFRTGEILDQFVFVTHRLHLILKIGSRAI